MYKKDIKLEKTIRSLSYDDKNLHSPILKVQPPSYSFNHCPKTGLYHKIKEPHDLSSDKGMDVLRKKTPEYLKNYFENAKTNVCQKNSPHDRFSNVENLRLECPFNSEILEYVYETILKYQSVGEEKVISSFEDLRNNENNYVSMNPLEIQKKMLKRIEDLYKPDDTE